MSDSAPPASPKPPRKRGGRHGAGRNAARRNRRGGGAAPSGAKPAATRPQGVAGAGGRGRNRLRRNVGLVIINAEGLVLAGLRSHANGDKAWQLPQGGIEGRERPVVAAYRELKEETGLAAEELELLAERKSWIDYWLPKEWVRGRRFAGQTQKWFAFRYKGAGLPDLSKAADHEFEALDWVEAGWLTEHVIDFRKKVYAEIFKEFGGYLKDMKGL